MKYTSYKVCILAARVEHSMQKLTHSINKAILPVNFKAVISHIIEKFPAEIELVVALGHKKDTIVDYLTLAHPNRKFTFVEINNIAEPRTNNGCALLQCRPNLQCPFIFCTTDTFVLEEVPAPEYNWLGVGPEESSELFSTVKIRDKRIYQIDNETKDNNEFGFIGLAGIKDYEKFFEGLSKSIEDTKGAIHIFNGLRHLIEYDLSPIAFTWHNTHTLEAYTKTNKLFSGENKFNFSKGSGDEFLYFVGNKVIKFFADKTITENRHERAQKYLNDLCPKIDPRKGNFYSYNKIEGQVFYDVLDRQMVIDFLEWARTHLWKQINLTEEARREYAEACEEFYVNKTKKRIQKFYDKTGITDTTTFINGISVPPLYELFKKINWLHVKDGTPSNFHGDLQFDNILFIKDAVDKKNKFLLLDWRQDFAGLVSHGDMYYDLAKLYGGTLVSYKLIKEAMFSFDMSDNIVHYNYFIKNDLNEAREEFEYFLKKHDFDIKKVKIITALIFLNMSPLHEEPFDKLLYFMGRSMLSRLI